MCAHVCFDVSWLWHACTREYTRIIKYQGIRVLLYGQDEWMHEHSCVWLDDCLHICTRVWQTSVIIMCDVHACVSVLLYTSYSLSGYCNAISI